MVQQNSSSKASSVRVKIAGRFEVVVSPLWVPQNTNIDNGRIVGSGLREINPDGWKDMPHVALANILTDDEQGISTTKPGPGLQINPTSVEQFVRTYGGFREAYGEIMEDEYGEIFDQDIAEVAKYQESLRRAWSFQVQGDEYEDLFHVQNELRWNFWNENYFNIDVFPGYRYDQIDLTTDDLWKFIRFLFLRDFIAGKIGFCGNPDCPAPYYMKSRSHQQFCLARKGACRAYAQRQYALKWWRDNKKGRPAKKHGKSPRRES